MIRKVGSIIGCQSRATFHLIAGCHDPPRRTETGMRTGSENASNWSKHTHYQRRPYRTLGELSVSILVSDSTGVMIARLHRIVSPCLVDRQRPERHSGFVREANSPSRNSGRLVWNRRKNCAGDKRDLKGFFQRSRPCLRLIAYRSLQAGWIP